MRLRYLATGMAVVGGVSVTAAALFGGFSKEPVPQALSTVGVWAPAPIKPPLPSLAPIPGGFAVAQPAIAVTFPPPALPAAATIETSVPTIELPRKTWSRKIASGETLDAVLSQAGLAAADRAEVALAIGVEYDLRRLRPGHELTVVTAPDGKPQRVVLLVDEGIRIEATFGERVATQVLAPETDVVTLAGEARIESSVSVALSDAGMPARFAVDLAEMLGEAVDFRRDLSGGEILSLMWREARVGEERIGQPEITYAALDLGGTAFEVVWPEDGSGRATIFRDGEVERVFAQPVEGARLSSVYGRRTHPVYGDTRMHTGVDFAAARGTPVYSTAAGRVRFIGRRGGYGRVVEIAHGSSTMTRYAHLSAVPDGLGIGDRVAAGDMIGRVGATGTATGPNLHYEVRVDGRPTDPLSDDRLAEAAEAAETESMSTELLEKARAQIAALKAGSDLDRT